MGVTAPTTRDDPSSPQPVGRAGSTLEFRILGPLEVLRDGAPLDLGGPRQRALLAIFVLSAGQVLASDVLVDRLWGDGAPPSGSGTLHAYISNLRGVLEPRRAPRQRAMILATTRPGYVLKVEDDAIDAEVFLRMAAEGHRALAARDPRSASETLRAALALWRGPALADLAGEPFAVVDVTRLEEARFQALEDRVEADLLLGRHSALVPELAALVGAHPLRERLRARLMVALYRSGQQSDALEVARAGREYLSEELGLDPHPAIRDLEERILRQDPALEWRPDVGADEAPPAAPSTTELTATARATEAIGKQAILDREGELAVLDRALRAAAEGSGRIVLIAGEPGIGKSGLVESFGAGLEGVRIGRGQSYDATGTPPFWPWRQALRDLTRHVDDSVLRRAVADAASTVADVVPELASRLPSEPAGAVADAAAARFQFFDATTRLITEVATQDPVIVILEDLQWADAASLDLLRFLAAGVRSARVLVVATYRDVGWEHNEAVAGTLADLARQPHLERLLLSGISREGVAELVATTTGRSPEDGLVDAVFARTDGNPLFVTHLARMLAGDAGSALDVSVRELVPPGISDLIGWQVGVLPERTRRLLTTSSVVGREFDLGMLVQVVGAPAAEVLAVIEPSMRAGLVIETDTPGKFRFTHALIRDAIRQEAGPSRVGHLHGQIGDAYAAARTDDLDVAATAEHYWRAASVGWVDEAITYALLAADRATVALSHEEEERHLARSLELVTEQPSVSQRDARELEIQLRLAKLHMRTRGYGVPEVATAASRARQLAAAVGARSEHLVATWGLVAHNIVRTRHGAALALALEMVEEAQETGDPVATVAGHQTAGVPLVFLGRPAEAITHLERSREAARGLSAEVLAAFPQNVEIGNLVYLALARWLVGEPDVATAHCVDGLELARSLEGYDEATMLHGAAQVAAMAGDHRTVVDHSARALAICDEIGYRHLAARLAVLHGWALSHLEDAPSAVAEIERGITYHREVGQGEAHVSYNHTLLADAHLQAGQVSAARAAIQTALDALTIWDERFHASETWRINADVLAADPASDLDAVVAAIRTAVRIADELGCPPLRERAEAQLASLTADLTST